MDDQVRADFAALGVTIKEDETLPKDDGAIEVWDVNAATLAAFLALDTSWRVIARGMAGVLHTLGLDYAAVDVLLRRQRAPRGTFDDVQVMEREALAVIREIEAEPA